MRGTAPFHSTAGEAECWREAIDEICTLDCITKDSKVLFATDSSATKSIVEGHVQHRATLSKTLKFPSIEAATFMRTATTWATSEQGADKPMPETKHDKNEHNRPWDADTFEQIIVRLNLVADRGAEWGRYWVDHRPFDRDLKDEYGDEAEPDNFDDYGAQADARATPYSTGWGRPYYASFRNININEPVKKLSKQISDATTAQYLRSNTKFGATAERLATKVLSAEVAERVNARLGPNELATATRQAEGHWHGDIRTLYDRQKNQEEAKVATATINDLRKLNKGIPCPFCAEITNHEHTRHHCQGTAILRQELAQYRSEHILRVGVPESPAGPSHHAPQHTDEPHAQNTPSLLASWSGRHVREDNVSLAAIRLHARRLEQRGDPQWTHYDKVHQQNLRKGGVRNIPSHTTKRLPLPHTAT